MRSKKWNEDDLKNAVLNSTSIRQVIHCLGLVEAGGNYDQVKKYIALYRFDTKHFTGRAWNKGRKGFGKPLIKLEDILVINSTYQSFKLKNRLFNLEIKKRECEECGWNKMSEDGRIPLELDHMNGDKKDNRLFNLRVLCPNCHSLKITHRGKNKRKK